MTKSNEEVVCEPDAVGPDATEATKERINCRELRNE
jgi:hypothetical protein